MTKATASIGAFLAQQRERLELTQEELARRMGVTQGWITQVETGKREPRWSTLLEFARALEVEPMFVPRARVPAVRAILQSESDMPVDVPPLAGGSW
jgi:transcriptional regulator with XRE-family HTH domain